MYALKLISDFKIINIVANSDNYLIDTVLDSVTPRIFSSSIRSTVTVNYLTNNLHALKTDGLVLINGETLKLVPVEQSSYYYLLMSVKYTRTTSSFSVIKPTLEELHRSLVNYISMELMHLNLPAVLRVGDIITNKVGVEYEVVVYE